jgi:hypothetical protein
MILEYLKNTWKGVLSVVGVLAVITAIGSFRATLATSADLTAVREETKSAISQLKKSMELDRDISRLNQINDSLMKAKIQQRAYPKDKDIAEDIETLKEDKAKVQERIDKR